VTQLNSPDLRQALAIAAGPDLIAKWRIGGGSVDLMEFSLTRSKDQGQALVLVAGAETGEHSVACVCTTG